MTSSTGTVVFNDAKLQAIDVVATERLGVGTLDPASNLHVVGNVHVTGNVNKLNFTDGYTIKRGANVTVFGTTDVIQEITGPHARHVVPLRKYPEVAMTNDVQGGYVVNTGSQYSDFFPGYNAFDEKTRTVGGTLYFSQPGAYLVSDGTPDTANVSTFNGVNGEYIALELPSKIRLNKFTIYGRNDGFPDDVNTPIKGRIFASNDNSSWVQINAFDNLDVDESNSDTVLVNDTSSYKYFTLVVEKIKIGSGGSPQTYLSIAELEYYGYEETSDPDTSVDTTITSQFNLPDTTGVKLYVDGDKGSTATDFSGEGHTLTENNATYDSAEKAWEFSSLSTSNVTMSTGDLAMEGTHPHSVSLWFNAANVSSNATLFHVGTAAGEGDAKTAISLTESGHLGWIDGGDNQFLSANTWHNLVYATQGGGGVRTCYLDGRKLGDVSVQDTFGEYPPFAMSTYSQYGYTVSASSVNNSYPPYKVFDDETEFPSNWISPGNLYTTSATGGISNGGAITEVDGVDIRGEWVQIEFPFKLSVDYVAIKPPRSQDSDRAPQDGFIVGSNDGITWTSLLEWTGITTWGTSETVAKNLVMTKNGFYKYFRLIVTRLQPNNTNQQAHITEIQYYGHKENDTTRFPVSSTVLKYPHITLDVSNGVGTYTKPAAKRGYVVTAHNFGAGGREPVLVFDGSTSTYWHGGFFADSSGAEGTSPNQFFVADSGSTVNLTDENSTVHYGSWLTLELPHKLEVSSIKIRSTGVSNDARRRFKGGKLFGSDTHNPTAATISGNYYQLGSRFDFANSSTAEATFTINATTAYKYITLLVDSCWYDGTNSDLQVYIEDYQIYGTEEDLDVVARVGEGLDGKVANFRVYDKYLHEEQALELWDAQKDQFGRAESSVVVHKGRLGVGTTEPEGRFAVLDEAHAPEEFPPRAMTDWQTYMEGHGVFRASADRERSEYRVWMAFDKSSALGDFFDNIVDLNGNNADQYQESSGDYIGSATTTTLDAGQIDGSWIQLQMPYKVKLSSFAIAPQSRDPSADFYGASRMPKTGSVVGSNDGMNWYLIGSITKDEYDSSLTYFSMNSTSFYSYFRLIAQTITAGVNSTYRNRLALSQFNLFGTRERGQSTLHDGSLTLTKNLTVPRIGPAFDGWASQTPRRDHLLIEYDTSTDVHNSKAMDSSGNENHGGFNNGASYSRSEGAFSFDGVDDYISGTLNNPAGAWVHSVSCWWNTSVNPGTSYDTIFSLGDYTATEFTTFYIKSDTILVSIYSSGAYFPFSVVLNRWYHTTVVMRGTTSSINDIDFYLDGVKLTSSGQFGTAATRALPANASLRLGREVGSGGNYFNGSISNFKIWGGVALGPGEVRQLYEMGRNGPGNYVHIVDTAVAIGRHAPQAQLDVSGKIRAQGSNTNFTGQHRCSSADGPLEKGLVVSASKSAYRNITGGLSTGARAITIDESLPVVSLSNVAQDKACFGVVSRTEEANTLTRSETAGGLISEAPKVLGDNRVIVNSVGEGAIWVCDANGPLESGDYITTSNVAGYGQKQTGEFLANYTVAKITMDCDFTGSNVAVQAIKKVETLKTVTEEVWEGLSDYDRSSNTETQYINESNVVLSVEEYESLAPEEQNTYSETTIQTYYRIQRGENVLDEHGMLQWENTGATEPGYELRYLDATGQHTDEANCVHRAAFVGCTYHCG